MKNTHILLLLTTFFASRLYCGTSEIVPTGENATIFSMGRDTGSDYFVPIYKTQKADAEVKYISLDDLAKEMGTTPETLRRYWTIKVKGTPLPFEQVGDKYYIQADWAPENRASLKKETFIFDEELSDIKQIIKARMKHLEK
jgi:hypothetical protein